MFRVNQLVIEHLSTHDRLNPRGGSMVFGVQTKLKSLLSGTQKIVKNGIKYSYSPLSRGVKNSKKQIIKCYNGRFLNTPKFPCYVVIRVQT